MKRAPTALIADDEPLLREALQRQLAAAWPELVVVAAARNGRDAVKLFEARTPDVCFLDVHMPGLSGIEAARAIGRRAHLVFVTAFDHYAVEAFRQGALDYLVKPVEPQRLAETVARLQERLAAAQPARDSGELLAQLADQIARLSGRSSAPQPMRWLRASVGNTLRMIAVDDIDFLRSDSKYTTVAWRGDGGQPAEAVVRVALKDLLAQLDPEAFVQVHRSVVVSLRAIDRVTRHDNETAEIHLRGRRETLPVSRSYLHLFRQM